MESTIKSPKRLLSFHGDEKIKEKYIERLRQHRIADEIVQGIGFEKGKGCAIGCTLNNYSHAAYEVELGIPRILAKLEDRIFEGLSVEESKDFPINFLTAIPVGRDLKHVYKHFFIWMLVDEKDGVIKYAKTDNQRTAISNVAALLKKSILEKVTSDEFREVAKAARSAYAADAAAYAAADAAYDDADAADDADDDARKQFYTKAAAKLIELLKAA